MRRNKENKDFNISNMPHNRIEVFKDILLNRSSTLFSVGIMLLIFAIPLIAIVFFSLQTLATLLKQN